MMECSISITSDKGIEMGGIHISGKDGVITASVTGAQKCIFGGNSTCTHVDCIDIIKALTGN